MPDYYKILGVTPNVTQGDLEAAYFRAIFTYKEVSRSTYGIIPKEERATKMLNEIEVAFNTLNDRQKRAEYNKMILPMEIETPEREDKKIENEEDKDMELPTAYKDNMEQLALNFVNKYSKKEISQEIIPPLNKADIPPTTIPFVSELTQLKSIRELKGINLRDIANETRISTNYLKAIEEADFSEMPEDIYTIGFIKTFALYLGLTPEQFIESYRRDRSR